jgi:hypothetical protein
MSKNLQYRPCDKSKNSLQQKAQRHLNESGVADYFSDADCHSDQTYL